MSETRMTPATWAGLVVGLLVLGGAGGLGVQQVQASNHAEALLGEVGDLNGRVGQLEASVTRVTTDGLRAAMAATSTERRPTGKKRKAKAKKPRAEGEGEGAGARKKGGKAKRPDGDAARAKTKTKSKSKSKSKKKKAKAKRKRR